MFEFRGKEYKSFAECCRKYNVPVNGGLRSYAQYHNVTRQQALEDFLKNNTYSPRKFEFRGKLYESVKECCECYGINSDDMEKLFNSIKKNKLTKQEAIEQHLKGNILFGFKFREKTYQSCAECCRQFNINPAQCYEYARIHNITKEEALEDIVSKNKKSKKRDREAHSTNSKPIKEYSIRNRTYKKIIFRNKEYDSFPECCRDYNIPYDIINNLRYYKSYHKATYQEILEKYLAGEIHIMPRGFIFRGKEYFSISECCREYNVSRHNIYKISERYNISMQDALERSITNNTCINNNNFIFKGKIYNSLKHCCNELGISYQKVYHYKRYYNISNQEALVKYLSKK